MGRETTDFCSGQGAGGQGKSSFSGGGHGSPAGWARREGRRRRAELRCERALEQELLEGRASWRECSVFILTFHFKKTGAPRAFMYADGKDPRERGNCDTEGKKIK